MRSSALPASKGAKIGPWVVEFVRREKEIADGIAHGIEEAAAAMHMPPALDMEAFGIGTIVEVVRPFGIRKRCRMKRSRNMRFPPVVEFALGAVAAKRASDEQHAMASMRDCCSCSFVDQHT